MGKVRRLSNEEIRQVLKRDELVEGMDRLTHWVKAHLENVIITLVITAVSAFGVFYWAKGRSEGGTRASIQLSSADQQLQRALGGGGNAEAATAAFQAVQSEFPGSRQGEAAALGLAHAAYEQGRFEEARAHYEGFAQSHAGSPLAPLAKAGHASSLEGLGKAKEAAEAWKALAESDPRGPLAALAWLDAARLYGDLKDQAGLKAAVEKLTALEKNGRFPESLKGRLKSLQSRINS